MTGSISLKFLSSSIAALREPAGKILSHPPNPECVLEEESICDSQLLHNSQLCGVCACVAYLCHSYFTSRASALAEKEEYCPSDVSL